MARVMADCRRFPSESNCSLTIIGEEEEVVRAAVEHGASVHGHDASTEMAAKVRSMLEPESAYQPGERPHEAFPA